MKFRRDWIVASLVSLLVMTLAQTPHILSYALAQPDVVFTGIIMNPEDAQSYFAKMLQGFDDAWLYTIPFTTEEYAPAFICGFYFALVLLALQAIRR